MLGWILPWSATGRYIAHLEEEIEVLRRALHMRTPGRTRKNGAKEEDAIPPEATRLALRFETHGPRLLEEMKRAHRRGQSWDELIKDAERYIATQVNGKADHGRPA